MSDKDTSGWGLQLTATSEFSLSTSDICRLLSSPPVCRIKPKYILFTSVQGDADLKIIAFFGKWNCVWCLTSKLVRAQLLLLINRLTVCCLVWMHWFWHAWHLAVVHPVEPEETNSDMFNRHSNIELSTISILCLGLIIGTLNIPFCTLQRFYFVQKKPIWIVCTYILIQLSSAKQPPAKNVFISKASFKKQTGFFYNCIFFRFCIWGEHQQERGTRHF